MRRRSPTAVQEPTSPNLIAMIDVMFLLLLFFLLGADMQQRERVALTLAEGPHAREDALRAGATTVNVHHRDTECATHPSPHPSPHPFMGCRERTHWVTSIAGRELDRRHLGSTLTAIAAANPEHSDLPDTRAPGRFRSAERLEIRADRGAPYGAVQAVIEASGAAGLDKIALVAALQAPR